MCSKKVDIAYIYRMNTDSTLTKTSQWVENYPTGYITKKKKVSTFIPSMLKHTESIQSSMEILKKGDNTKTKEPGVSDKVMKPITALTYESFTHNFLEGEQFFPVNMSSHMDPIWVIIAFLLAIWIIYFIDK